LAVNSAVLGGDHATNPGRRSAIETARDRSEPVLTKPVQITRRGQRVAGLILYVPVYRAGAALETVVQRRSALKAIVEAAFVAEEFFDSTLGPLAGQLKEDVFAGTADGSNWLYGSEHHSFAARPY